MVVAVDNHALRWLAPSPLWRGMGDLTQPQNREYFVRPAILRFGTDEFMEEFLAAVNYYPERIGEWLVRNETWRAPMARPSTSKRLLVAEPISTLERQLTRQAKVHTGRTAAVTIASDEWIADHQSGDLKLFQPAQQRFYLAAASLVCRQPGLPDRAVDAGKEEAVSFVVRRLIHPAGAPPALDDGVSEEYAYVIGSNGPRWVRVDTPPTGTESILMNGEERQPMFTVSFIDERNKNRKLLAGLIPVARREAYVGAATTGGVIDEDEGAGDEMDPRMVLFESDVAAPWKNLLEQAQHEKDRLLQLVRGLDESPPVPPIAGDLTVPSPVDTVFSVTNQARDQIQTISWYIILDLATFLRDNLTNVWDYVLGNTTSLNDKEEDVVQRLQGTEIPAALTTELVVRGPTDVPANLFLALRKLTDAAIETGLETVETPYNGASPAPGWPTFQFPLASVSLPVTPAVDPPAWPAWPIPDIAVTEAGEPDRSQAIVDEFAGLVRKALPTLTDQTMPATATPPGITGNPRDGWFVIRCLYERPNCGPFSQPVLSKPSRIFEMASFFDPDAPARPIRIPMPVDVSPAGLRKFAKNTSFQISDSLCGQLKKIRKFTLGDLVLSVLPWPFHKDLPDPSQSAPCEAGDGSPLGMFCSLSIPIVTLCALILLFIMVALFDIFFKWLPLLFICFPLLGFKGKK